MTGKMQCREFSMHAMHVCVFVCLCSQTRQTLEKLQVLVSSDGRFRSLRDALHRCDPPCIPYLGMYLTDLSFIEEGTPNFTEDGLLNFSKMRMVVYIYYLFIQNVCTLDCREFSMIWVIMQKYCIFHSLIAFCFVHFSMLVTFTIFLLQCITFFTNFSSADLAIIKIKWEIGQQTCSCQISAIEIIAKV